jgi:antagonist of KipI
MSIRIIKPGVLTTVQDNGRLMYLSQAVPVSGVMDTLSARVANEALGNDKLAAVIEFTYGNAEFKTEADVLIAYSGEGATLTINNKVIPDNRPVFIPAGLILTLATNPMGSRTYIAIAGGWDVPEVLESKSTYLMAGFGGFNGRALRAGDTLSAISNLNITTKSIWESLKSDDIKYPLWSIPKVNFLPLNNKVIRVVPAHEFTWFGGLSILNFLSEPYTLSLNSNRMGYHLDGPLINRLSKQELLSTAVTPGTIQVTNNGKLILLMADGQTTGGYARIAQVAAVDLPLCAQLNPGDTINFKEISRNEAEALYLDRELELDEIRTAVKNRFLYY